MSLIVLAKAPVPGRVKTRLTPPCTPEEAAALAEASLRDTLEAVARTTPDRALVLDGDWPHAGPTFETVPQRGTTLNERLKAAFDDVGAPALLVGMDTPQLTPALLTTAIAALQDAGTDAVLGPALDGGYWTIGFTRPPHALAFDGVPMSAPTTCRAQRARLRRLGLTVRDLPPLRDVDTIDDARAVALQASTTRFAQVLGDRKAA